MAIVREGSTLFETVTTGPGFYTTVDEEATVQSGTTLSILTIHMFQDIDVTETPSWNGTEDFTLIRELVGIGNQFDAHTYIYGLVNPTATTADIDYTVDSTDDLSHTLVNYSGTISSSVADATNFLNEVLDDTGSTTAVHASAGTTGATLFLAATVASAGGDPMSNDASFAEISEGDAFDSGIGVAYYVIDKIGGAPSAVTVTFNEAQEHASILIEILPATSSTPTANLHGPLGGCFRGVL